MPGWSLNGIYNFQPGGTTQLSAAQLKVLLQSGPHAWINETITGLLTDPAFTNLPKAQQTQRLAALVDFKYEANSAEALASGGGTTGGYVAFSSKSDANLIKQLGHAPTQAEMESLRSSVRARPR